MSADELGNDIKNVAVPVTGRGALAPFGTTIPTPVEGKELSLALDEAFRTLGLRTTDGAPEWAWEKDGDDIEFFEEGYRIPSGLANVTCKMILAETSPFVREVISGKKPDANGYITFDGGGHDTRYVLWTEEAFKNLDVRRRVAPWATVQSAVEIKPERGQPLRYEITFKIERHASVGGDHFGEWYIKGTETVPED